MAKWIDVCIAFILSVILSYSVVIKLLQQLYLDYLIVLFVVILTYLIYFILQIIRLNVTKQEIKLSFVVYLVVIFIALFLKGYSETNVILSPLSFLNVQEVTPLQTVLNVLLMIPLGIYVCHYQISLLIVLPSFVLLEGIQYLSNRGTFDVGDIVLYIVGLFIGICLHFIYKKYFIWLKKYFTKRV